MTGDDATGLCHLKVDRPVHLQHFVLLIAPVQEIYICGFRPVARDYGPQVVNSEVE